MITLSKRLQKVSEFVIPQFPIADIGSDHAYLPIYLIQNSIIPSAIIGEVAMGPFKNAQDTVKMAQLNDRVSIRLGDGLSILNKDDLVGTIFICGMGGILIRNILKEGISLNKLPQKARLVLQPNNNEALLRKYLLEDHYKIIDEAIVEEKGKIYEILVAESTNEKIKYTDEELLFGPVLMKQQPAAFKQKWETVLFNNLKILSEINNTSDSEEIQRMKELTKQIEKVVK